MSQQQREVNSAAYNPTAAKEPQYWWQIMNRELAEPLPFQNLYEEWLLVSEPHPIKESRMESAKRSEYSEAEPARNEADSWGDDQGFVNEWFGEGDNFCECKPMQALELELELGREQDREERIDRALGWMRSLAVATGLVPA